MSKTLINKFEIDSKYTEQLLDSEKDESVLETLREKFEGDLIQIFTYIWEKILSKGQEEDDFEIELIESAAKKFGLEKTSINDTRKLEMKEEKQSKQFMLLSRAKLPITN